MSSLLCGLPIDSCFGSKNNEAQRKRVVTKTTTTTTVVHVNNSFNYGLSDDKDKQYHPPVGDQNGSQKNIDTDNSGSDRRNSLSSFQSESTVHIIESVKEQEETVEPSEELERNPLRWLTIPFKAFKARYQDESADKKQKKKKGNKDKLKFKEKRNNKGKKEVISRTIVVSKKNHTTGGGKDEIEEGSLPSIPPQVMKRHFQSGEDELLFLENQMPFIRKVASLKVMRSSTTTRSSYAESLSPTAKNGSIALHVLPMKTRSPTNHFGMNYKFSVPPSPRIHHQ